MNNIYEAPQADLTPKRHADQDNGVTQTMIDNLEIGGKWSKFLAILGYLTAGLMGIATLASLIGVFQVGLLGIIMLLIYGGTTYLTYRISSFIHQYSKSVQALAEYGDIGDMLDAQEYFNSYVKWMGMTMLIWLLIMGVFFPLGLAGFAFLGTQF